MSMSLIKHISTSLNLDRDYIENIAKNSRKFYSRYKIKKRNGKGERLIYHPSPALKTLQYWLVHNYFNRIHISQYSFAYRKGYSIKLNAEQHINSRHILHLDISNFFESITRNHLVELLRNNMRAIPNLTLTDTDINFICDVCLYDDHLVIGSVCSPVISNCIMKAFDEEIRDSIPKDIIYTRYADDMVFSSNSYIPNRVISIVEKTLLKYNFRINHSKTYFMSDSSRKTVSGLNINNKTISIGLKKKKQIKKMIYEKLKKGIGDDNRILGYLAYLKDIEPAYFNRLIVKYSPMGNIIAILKEGISTSTINSITQSEVASTSEK